MSFHSYYTRNRPGPSNGVLRKVTSTASLDRIVNWEFDDDSEEETEATETANMAEFSEFINCSDTVEEKSKIENLQNFLYEAITNGSPLCEIKQLVEAGTCVDGDFLSEYVPLHHAVECRHLECIRHLVKKGANINAADDNGCTPLLLAAKNGSYCVMELLIDTGAAVNYCDAENQDIPEYIRQLGYLTYEPLNIAIENNHVQCVRLLLERGASANKEYYMGHEINLIPINHTECLELLLQYGANTDVFGMNGMTPLMNACKGNQIEAVRLLLKFGANVNTTCPSTFEQKTAISFAIENLAIDIVKVLMQNGATVWSVSGNKLHPVHLAVLQDSTDMCNLLLSGDTTYTEKDISTVLMVCAKTTGLNEQEAIMECLLQRGTEPNTHEIISYAHIERTDVAVSQEDSVDCQSVLVEYVQNNQTKLNIKIIQLLLRHGARVNIQTYTPSGKLDPFGILHYLSELCNMEVLDLLASAAKSFNTKDILEADRLNQTQRDFLMTRARSPRPLKHLVRLSFIDIFGKFYTRHVKELPLPSILKQYLLYEK